MTIELTKEMEVNLVRESQMFGLSPNTNLELILSQQFAIVNHTVSTVSTVTIPNQKPQFGSAKGMITIPPEFDDPLPEFDEYSQ